MRFERAVPVEVVKRLRRIEGNQVKSQETFVRSSKKAALRQSVAIGVSASGLGVVISDMILNKKRNASGEDDEGSGDSGASAVASGASAAASSGSAGN